MSFCFATVAVLYLIGKTGVLRGSKSSPFSILLLCLSPFGIAGYVAVSRTQDCTPRPAPPQARDPIGNARQHSHTAILSID